MPRRSAVVVGLIALGGCGPLAATDTGQDDCHVPASHRWENAPPSWFTGATEIDRELLRPVLRDLPDAVQLLALRPAVEISADDARRFTGSAWHPADGGLRPYLVRAVYPNAAPQLHAYRHGGSVSVSASALGCAAFVGHPVVLFLSALPEAVFVDASATL